MVCLLGVIFGGLLLAAVAALILGEGPVVEEVRVAPPAPMMGSGFGPDWLLNALLDGPSTPGTTRNTRFEQMMIGFRADLASAEALRTSLLASCGLMFLTLVLLVLGVVALFRRRRAFSGPRFAEGLGKIISTHRRWLKEDYLPKVLTARDMAEIELDRSQGLARGLARDSVALACAATARVHLAPPPRNVLTAKCTPVPTSTDSGTPLSGRTSRDAKLEQARMAVVSALRRAGRRQRDLHDAALALVESAPGASSIEFALVLRKELLALPPNAHNSKWWMRTMEYIRLLVE